MIKKQTCLPQCEGDTDDHDRIVKAEYSTQAIKPNNPSFFFFLLQSTNQALLDEQRHDEKRKKKLR